MPGGETTVTECPIISTSLSDATFTVSRGITGSITIENLNKRAVFTINSNLAAVTTYTVTLSGVTDSNGNPIFSNNEDYSWSFSTCSSTTSSTYTLSRDPITDADINGYKVYYGTTYPLTKGNSTAIDVGNTTNWVQNG